MLSVGALVVAVAAAITAVPTTAVAKSAGKTNSHGPVKYLPKKAHDKQNKAGAQGPGADGTTNMAYHGGPVMRDVTTYAIFWNPTSPPAGAPSPLFGPNYRSTVDRYFQDISGTPYFDILTQYGDSSGAPVPATTHFGGDWVDTTTYPHLGTSGDPLQDSDIDAAITRAIAANTTWQTTPLNTMYFVFTGKNIIECASATSCFAASDYNGVPAVNGSFCAYHWWNSLQVYGYIPYASTGGCYGNQTAYPNGVDQDIALTATSHEQFEAFTDPYGGSWYDDVNGIAGENGDKCAYNYGPYETNGSNLTLHGHAYQIQTEWSNGSPHGCVKRFGPHPTLTITGDLNFGTVKRGSTATKQLALQNTGNGDLDILDVKLGAGTDAAYSVTPASPNTATLAAGDTALVNVKFSPPASSSATARTGSLVVDSDDTPTNNTGAPTSAQLTDVRTVSATGTPGLPQLQVTGSLNFGTVPRGDTATRNVVIQNIGTGDLSITNVALSGASDAAYSLSPSSPTSGTLPPGGSLVAQVIFSPPASATAPGPLTGSLVVTSDDPSNPSVSVPATGTVGLPKAAVSPGSINFGVVCPGSFADKQLTVTNTGTAPLTINSITIGGGSSAGLSVLSIPGLPQTLPVGSHLSFTVRFAPPGPLGGPAAGTVVVDTDDPVNPLVSVPITGTVGAAAITVGSSTLDFGGVPTDDRTSPSFKTKSLNISNTGTCALSVASLVVTGPAGSDFTLVGAPTLPLNIGPGSSVTLSVKFNPSAAGVRNGTLTINSTDPVNPATAVALTGIGLVPAILATPASLTYAPTVILSQAPGYTGRALPTEVANTGQSELIVDQLGTGGAPFSAPGPASPPSRYAPNNHFTESVTFGPTTVGKFLDTLTIADTDPEGGATASVPLCGEGVGRGIRVLAVNAAGLPFASIAALKLQGKGTAAKVNVNAKNLAQQAVTTSCQAGEQMQYQNQTLPVAQTVNQRASYYTLSITAGGKSTTVTFTLGVSEFKTMLITIK
ncbi:MAG: hypothetical protein QOJ03_2744 [Frankiaceae bacterium]|nr:hypothetical protein [Frankiaceae bacterium]